MGYQDLEILVWRVDMQVGRDSQSVERSGGFYFQRFGLLPEVPCADFRKVNAGDVFSATDTKRNLCIHLILFKS